VLHADAACNKHPPWLDCLPITCVCVLCLMIRSDVWNTRREHDRSTHSQTGTGTQRNSTLCRPGGYHPGISATHSGRYAPYHRTPPPICDANSTASSPCTRCCDVRELVVRRQDRYNADTSCVSHVSAQQPSTSGPGLWPMLQYNAFIQCLQIAEAYSGSPTQHTHFFPGNLSPQHHTVHTTFNHL